MAEYQKIYNLLRKAGASEAGALGILGNWDCESNCEPYRLQGDFSSMRTVSKAYVNSLNNGSLTRERFSKDSKGFGVAQWTYWTRKQDMYDTWKSSGLAIDSADFQVAFAVKEFKRDFANDWKLVCTTNDIYEAVKAVCARFENPAVHNTDARFQSATRIKFQIYLNEWNNENTVQPNPPGGNSEKPFSEPGGNLEPPQVPSSEYWPPRMVDKSMNGVDVMVLQAVLKARGYQITEVDGYFGSYLDAIVRQFQEDYSLGADGVVGPKTWKKLLELS